MDDINSLTWYSLLWYWRFDYYHFFWVVYYESRHIICYPVTGHISKIMRNPITRVSTTMFLLNEVHCSDIAKYVALCSSCIMIKLCLFFPAWLTDIFFALFHVTFLLQDSRGISACLSVVKSEYFFIISEPKRKYCGNSDEPSHWDGLFGPPKQILKLMDNKIFAIVHSKCLLIITYGPSVCRVDRLVIFTMT